MLLAIESFDHLTTQAQLATKGWTIVGTVTLEAAAGRRGTGNIRTTGSNGCTATKVLSASHASGVVGLALSSDSFTAQDWFYFSIMDGSTCHLSVEISTAGNIKVKRGFAGTTLCTGSTALSINTFYYVEMKFTIDDTTGSVEVRLNGSGSPECSFSGDTRNGGNSTWNGLRLHGQQTDANSPFVRFDDIYLCNSTDSGIAGLPNNDFLGDVRCDAYLPSTGNGSNTGLTTSTGSDHGALVDESTPNDDTDYNYGVNVGDKDTYNYPSLSTVPLTIFGVQTVPRVKKTDAGARSICSVIRSGGTDYDGANSSVSTSYTYYPTMWEADPDTGDEWTESGIADLEAGMKVTV